MGERIRGERERRSGRGLIAIELHGTESSNKAVTEAQFNIASYSATP